MVCCCVSFNMTGLFDCPVAGGNDVDILNGIAMLNVFFRYIRHFRCFACERCLITTVRTHVACYCAVSLECHIADCQFIWDNQLFINFLMSEPLNFQVSTATAMQQRWFHDENGHNVSITKPPKSVYNRT